MSVYVGGVSRWVVNHAALKRPIGMYIHRQDAETVKKIAEDIILSRTLRRRADECLPFNSGVSLHEIKGSFLLRQRDANRLSIPTAREYQRVIGVASKLPLD